MKIKEFEQKIGYQFQNRNYLETALTHSSFNREKNTKHQDNERLEFLGDAFFDAVISVELYERLKHVTEGKLTKTRALIVCESALAQVARGYELGSYLNLGHGFNFGRQYGSGDWRDLSGWRVSGDAELCKKIVFQDD